MKDAAAPKKAIAPESLSVRKLRFGLLSKLFTAFAIILIGYAFISNGFLLNYFFKDKSRYIFYSLHQSAEALCDRLAIKAYTPAEEAAILRQNHAASVYLFADQGHLQIKNEIDPAQAVAPTLIWNFLQKRSEQGRIANFTTEWNETGRTFFVSACRFDQAGTSKWLTLTADADMALSPAKALLAQMVGLFALLLILGFAVFWLLARTLTRPLEKLSAWAGNLGAGNYKQSIEVKNSDELGVLSDYFSILAHRLNLRETELEQSTELANQDFLTGLWNRRYLERRLEEYFSLAKRHQHALSLVYLDIDHFKRINDTYGHSAGDEVLKDFAHILKTQMRKTDFVARIGGEEFIMVLPDTDLQGALQAAQLLRNNLKQRKFLDDAQINVTASMGVVSIKDGAFKDSLSFMGAADEFAYASKRGGRDRISSPTGQIS